LSQYLYTPPLEGKAAVPVTEFSKQGSRLNVKALALVPNASTSILLPALLFD